MASAWGLSWGGAWGNSWGSFAQVAARVTGATYLTEAELKRYKAYWRELAQIEARRFKSEKARERAFTETIERAYRKAKGIPEPLIAEAPRKAPARPKEPPTIAAKTLTYLEELRPRSESVFSEALTELFYLQQRIDQEREIALRERNERRALEDEEEFLMLLS